MYYKKLCSNMTIKSLKSAISRFDISIIFTGILIFIILLLLSESDDEKTSLIAILSIAVSATMILFCIISSYLWTCKILKIIAKIRTVFLYRICVMNHIMEILNNDTDDQICSRSVKCVWNEQYETMRHDISDELCSIENCLLMGESFERSYRRVKHIDYELDTRFDNLIIIALQALPNDDKKSIVEKWLT